MENPEKVSKSSLASTVLFRSWSVHRVSPLYRFDPKRLSVYSKQLCRIVRAAYEWQLPESELKRRSKNRQRAGATVAADRLGTGSCYLKINVRTFFTPKPREDWNSKSENVNQLARAEAALDAAMGVPELKMNTTTLILCCPGDELSHWDESIFCYGPHSMDSDEVDDNVEEEMNSYNGDRNDDDHEAFSKFRFVLAKGKTGIIEKVFAWITERFDCSISVKPVLVPPRILAQIADACTRESLIGRFGKTILMDGDDEDYRDNLFKGKKSMDDGADSNSDDDSLGNREKIRLQTLRKRVDASKKPQPLELSFTLPGGVSEAGLSRISVAVPPSSLQRLVDSLSEPLSNIAEAQASTSAANEVNDAHAKAEMINQLQNGQLVSGMNQDALNTAGSVGQEDALLAAVTRFVAQQLHIRLNGSRLTQISTPLVMLSGEGRVKFLNERALEMLLMQLMNLCEVETEKTS